MNADERTPPASTLRAAPAPAPAMIDNLQALRGIAATLIVMLHSPLSRHNPFSDAYAVNALSIGVDLFFVLSGFVMVHSVHHRPRGAAAFMGDRLLRVAPLYWIATAALLVLFALGMRPAGLHDFDAGDVAAALLFWPNVRADGVEGPILSLGWTLNYEMLFYALFAAAMLLGRGRAALTALSAALIGLALLGWTISSESFVFGFYANAVVLEFLAGAWLAAFVLSGRADGPGAAAVGALLLVGALAAIFVIETQQAINVLTENTPPLRWLVFGAPALAIVAGAVLLERSGWRLRSGFWRLLGAASYAIYLFHMFALQPATKAADALGLRAVAPDALVDVGVVAVSCAAGVAVHLAVERPIARAIRPLRRRRAG